MDINEQVEDFNKRVNAEVEEFNKGVDEIINTFESTLRNQIHTKSHKEYSAYLMSVLEHNKNAGSDDFMEPMSFEEWMSK